jgi:malate synthase
VGVQYLEAWLRGNGCVPLYNLMEDAATAEISRSQIWQQVHGDVTLSDTGEKVTADVVRRVADEEIEKIRAEVGADTFDGGRWKEARDIFEEVALADDFDDFLTLPAYEQLD